MAKLRRPPRGRAAALVSAGRLARLVIEVAANTLLMRMLGPAPFGLVAISTAMLAAFAAIDDAGVGSSLVSDKALSPRRAGAAFLVSLGVSGVTILVCALVAPLVVAFYGDPRLGPIWLTAAAGMALGPIGSVPQSLAQRNERFGLIAAAAPIAALVGAIVSLGVATQRQDHWPILLRSVLTAGLVSAIYWTQVRPAIAWPDREDLNEVLRYGRGLVGFNVINAVARNTDNVVVGRALGDEQLGLYALAYRILTLPLGQISQVATTVTFPRLAKLYPDGAAVSRVLGYSLESIALLVTPFSLAVAFAAPEVIATLFGPEWAGALVPFRALALLAIIQAPYSQMSVAFRVSRRTDLLARWGLFSAVPMVLSFIVGAQWGIDGVAIAYSLVSIAVAAPVAYSAAAVLAIPARAIFGPTFRGIVKGALISTPLLLVCAVARAAGVSAPLAVALTAVAGAITEAAIVYFLVYGRRDKLGDPAPPPASTGGEILS